MGETELSSVEGQRVMQVLDETLNATRLISCVTPDPRSRSANITDMVGPEVTDLLLAHPHSVIGLAEVFPGQVGEHHLLHRGWQRQTLHQCKCRATD